MKDYEFYLEDLKSKFGKIDHKKYYLSYSGGKDSHFLYWFIKEYLKDHDIEIVSCNTFMEHNQIQKRMERYADVIIHPSMKPLEIKEKHGSPCFSKMQDEMIDRYQRGSRSPSLMQFINGTKNNGNTMFKLNKQARELLLSDRLHRVSNKCCYYLKKEPFKKYEHISCKKAILGVRSTESILRKAQYTTCFNKNGKFTPLFDLTDEILDHIYEVYNIEIPPIYNMVSRTGCMGCPYGSKFGDTIAELRVLNKNQYNFVRSYFKESYQVLGISEVQTKMDI